MSEYDYDVCISYARDEGRVPRAVARQLTEWGYKVYIDLDDEEAMIGHDLPTKLADVFEHRSRLCAIFVTEHWKTRPYAQFERKAALSRAVRQPGYIYPVRYSDKVTMEGLPGGTLYLNAGDLTPRAIAERIDDRLENRRAGGKSAAILHFLAVDAATLDGASSDFDAYLGLLENLPAAEVPRAIVFVVRSGNVPADVLAGRLEALVGLETLSPTTQLAVALLGTELPINERAVFARTLERNERLEDSLAVSWDGTGIETLALEDLGIVLCFFSSKSSTAEMRRMHGRLRGRVAVGVTDDAAQRVRFANEVELDVLIAFRPGSTECLYQEYLDASATHPYRQGVYVVGADAAYPLRLHVSESTNAHRERPPSAICSLARMEREGERFTVRAPSHRFLIDRPIYHTLRVLQEHLGRSNGNRKKAAGDLRKLVNRVWPDLLDLQASLDDWQSEERWEVVIRKELPEYTRVVCTDRLGPLSWINPRLLEYLGGHFEVRKARRNDDLVHLSQATFDAAVRTKWAPRERLMVRNGDCNELEIARILIWNTEELSRPIEKLILRVIDQYHRLFDVPLFVIDRTDIEPPDPLLNSEFIVATGPRLIRAYTFDPADFESVDEYASQATSLLEAFDRLLAHPKLRAAGAYAYAPE